LIKFGINAKRIDEKIFFLIFFAKIFFQSTELKKEFIDQIFGKILNISVRFLIVFVGVKIFFIETNLLFEKLLKYI